MPIRPSFPIDERQPLAVEVARGSLQIRANQSVQARVVVPAAVLVAGLAFSLVVPAWRVIAWMVPVMLMAQATAAMARRVLAGLASAAAQELSRDKTLLWWMNIGNQTAMGLTVWWIGSDQPTALPAMATALQLIYLAGSLINSSTHPPTFIAGACVNLSFAIVFWFTHSDLGWAITGGLLAMGFAAARSAQRTAAAFVESLRMRFENADLLRKLAQEKRAAEEASAAKSRFLAAASHDLRQPLHALLVFSTLLHKHETAATRELVAHIRTAAASLDKLFAGLLDLSKLETGGFAPQLQAVHANSIAAALVLEYDEACREKGIAIRVEGSEQWVLTDPFLLERILRNLIDNAVKYTHAGEVVIRIRPGASRCCLEVQDTGEGIPEHAQPRIFEEYFQVGNAARDMSKGSGLGLAIVRRLCRLLDVPIELESEAGRGTTFRLDLQPAPMFDLAGGSAAEEAPVPAPLSGLQVWLIEDNELVRLATRRALEDLGATVSHWPDLPDEPAPAQPPDALVADYRLAGPRNGLQVAVELRRRWPSLPVAIVTGDPEIDPHALDGQERMVLLRKPVVPAVLGRWIHQHAARGTAARALADQAILTP